MRERNDEAISSSVAANTVCVCDGRKNPIARDHLDRVAGVCRDRTVPATVVDSTGPLARTNLSVAYSYPIMDQCVRFLQQGKAVPVSVALFALPEPEAPLRLPGRSVFHRLRRHLRRSVPCAQGNSALAGCQPWQVLLHSGVPAVILPALASIARCRTMPAMLHSSGRKQDTPNRRIPDDPRQIQELSGKRRPLSSHCPALPISALQSLSRRDAGEIYLRLSGWIAFQPGCHARPETGFC